MKNLDLHEKTINIDISPSRKQKKNPLGGKIILIINLDNTNKRNSKTNMKNKHNAQI